MIKPPPNPKQVEARAAIMAHTAPLLSAPARDDTDDAARYPYRLTWPGTDRAVCTVAGQWQRNDAGEIEAWYTAAQLGVCLEMMQEARQERMTL